MERILFTRIHKTGSTSVAWALRSLFEPQEICPYMHGFRVRAAPAEELARYRFFQGHITPAAVREKLGEVHAFTVLREPRSRLISAYGHWHKHGPNAAAT